MSTRAFGAPGRYIQGPGELDRLDIHAKKFGSRVFAVIDGFFFETMERNLKQRFSSGTFLAECFPGEITKDVIGELSAKAGEFRAEVIVGIGGGKTLDTGKAVASELSLPVIVAPTSASTDAPTSAMSVIYNDAHEHDDVYYYDSNPDLVLVDSRIIAEAPVRFLVAGMGDALATVYEARASIRSGSPNYVNQESGPHMYTLAAAGIAERCGETVLRYGAAAKKAAEEKQITEALENIIEANTLMSGLGFENVGCAGSHVICNGITACPNGNDSLHGEKVAYGILCQLTAEKAPEGEIEELMGFYEKVGLPLLLEDMGIEETDGNLRIIASDTAHTEWTREPFDMDDEAVISVIRQVQKRSREFRRKAGSA